MRLFTPHPIYSVRVADEWFYITAPQGSIRVASILVMLNIITWSAIGLYEAVRVFV